jgi:adenosylhomocysteine nucleosidase
MTRIAIIAAMPAELKPFLNENAKEGWVHERRGNVHLWRLIWPLNQGEWIAACAGAGVNAAARAFAEVEKSGDLDLVISTGWAGALREEFSPGKACDVSAVIDARTGERFVAACPPSDCWLVTSPKVADAHEKLRLAETYQAALVDMEAAGIARLAQMRGIPFYCIKGISDGYSDQLPDFNRFISSDGHFKLARFILFALLRPWHWPALIRMGENSKRAAQSIADSLLDLLHERGSTDKRNGDSNHKR